jgi:F0F1-type ATP synthase assembly protein I
MPSDDLPPLSGWAVASTVSTSLIGPVVLGILLDVSFGWTPWGTIVGVLFGLFSCLALLIRLQRSRGGSGDTEGGGPQ